MNNFKRLLESFDTQFLRALGNVQRTSGPEEGDLEDDRVSANLKKNLEYLVKILNKKVDDEWTEPQYYKMIGKLFIKKEAKRILNHFVRRGVITGAYSGSKMKFMVIRKIERTDYRNFY